MYYKSDRGSSPQQRPPSSKRPGLGQTKYQAAILPSPAVLRAYEEILEGSMERILEMAEIEQNHRHDWEAAALISYEKSYRFGQKCGVIATAIITFASTYVGYFLEQIQLAEVIAVSGFASIIVSTIFAAKNKRYESRIRRSVSAKSERERNQE